MHLVISFAAAPGPRCQAALAQLQLPHLKTLLGKLLPAGEVQGQSSDLSPVSERVLSNCAFADGLVPWAALRASSLPEADAGAAWGLITPCHLRVHADHVTLQDPADLRLESEESKALMRAMSPYFLEDGLKLHYLQADSWLVQGEALRGLPTASLERVRGQVVDPWLPRLAAARLVRRLQNEMQMLLYTHPINDARAARGVPVVNSFWLSGTGDLPADAPPLQHATAIDTLQGAGLRDDASAWAQAWQALDQGPLAQLVQAVKNSQTRREAQTAPASPPLALTLCASQSARTWRAQPRSLLRRVSTFLHSPSTSAVLRSL